jgi:hypothetical protein
MNNYLNNSETSEYHTDHYYTGNLKLEIAVPQAEMFHLLGFVQTLINKNKWKFKLTFKLDYISEDSGTYFFADEPNTIYLNPDQCKKKESYGLADDDSVFGTGVHEFCHYLSMTHFKKFQEKYLFEFPEERIILTKYKRAQQDINEEIAEVMSLHLRNPYLLKLLHPNHHKFMQQYIKPYVACTQRKFIEIYNLLEQKDKEMIFKKYNIIIEYDTQTVIKV